MWKIEVKSSDYRVRPWTEWQPQEVKPTASLETLLMLALTWKGQGQAVRITWEENPS